ncbi:MAG: diguanylate cyclase [Sulfuritalea sp.]|nr:diguanylate cyclase [Sulfuritalea sp.]
MKIRRIRHKLLIVLAIALSLGFITLTYFYTRAVEASILADYQRTLHRLTESVAMNIETIMAGQHAEVMPDFARRLKNLPGVIDFRVARLDGTEAYLDNLTIDRVNQKLGEAKFPRRKDPAEAPKVFSPDDPGVASAIEGEEVILTASEGTGPAGTVVHFYDPIPHTMKCSECHERKGKVRGVIKLTTSMAEAERDMMKARLQSLVVLVAALVLTMAITGYMLGRFVAKPIEDITAAMKKVTGGNFNVQVRSARRDELGRMAGSFNKMTADLQRTYRQMRSEQEKLYSVIQGAQEAVIVTDAGGEVVLVNDAAEDLLGKTIEQIRADGIFNVIDQPERFHAMIEDANSAREPALFEYKGRWLLTSATTIRDETGVPLGSAALLRDVTLEQALLKELARLSITDALTDVFNRRHLDATLGIELGRASETGLPLAVIMFDADHFKKFNDAHGHDQGDRVLQMLGKRMKQTLREYDVPCRYGGEEFVVILPGTDRDGALHVAERLRLDVAAMTVDGLTVTISLGIACFPLINAKTPEALLAAADAALYRSKEGGRNRCTLATPEMLTG